MAISSDRRAATPGREALAQYIEAECGSQRKLAKVLGVGQQSVSLWTRGSNRPGYAHMLALEAVTGIPPGAWLNGDERRMLTTVKTKLHETRRRRRQNGHSLEA